MAQPMTPADIADFQQRNGAVDPATVPPAGLRFFDLGRTIVVFKKVSRDPMLPGQLGMLVFTDASDLPAARGNFDQFPDGVPGEELTTVEGQNVVASLPAIMQNALKETMATIAGGVSTAVNETGKGILAGIAGAAQGVVQGAGLGTLLLVGLILAGVFVWKKVG